MRGTIWYPYSKRCSYTMHTQTALCQNFNCVHLISPNRITVRPVSLVLIKNAKLDMQWLLFQLPSILFSLFETWIWYYLVEDLIPKKTDRWATKMLKLDTDQKLIGGFLHPIIVLNFKKKWDAGVIIPECRRGHLSSERWSMSFSKSCVQQMVQSHFAGKVAGPYVCSFAFSPGIILTPVRILLPCKHSLWSSSLFLLESPEFTSLWCFRPLDLIKENWVSLCWKTFRKGT